MAEQVDAQDLKSCGRIARVGSSPTPSTSLQFSNITFASTLIYD